MINISIDKINLILPDDFSIRLNFKFPTPEAAAIPVGSTYTVSVKANGTNNNAFANANFVYGINKIKIYDCLLIVASDQLKAKLYLTDAGKLNYKFFIIINNPLADIANTKLTDVVEHTHFLGNNEDEIIAEAKRISQGMYPTENYAFPMIYNNKFFGDKNEHFQDIVNNYKDGQYFKTTSDLTEVYNINTLVPMPYLLFVIKNIFEQSGFNVDENLIANFDKLIVYNNFANQRSTAYDFVNASKIEETILPDDSGKQILFSNIIEDTENRFANNKYSCRTNGSYKVAINFKIKEDYVPDNYVCVLGLSEDDNPNSYIPVQSLQFINNEIYIELANNIDLETKDYSIIIEWIDNTATGTNLTVYDIDFKIYPASEYFRDRYAKYIELKNHMPDINVSEFLNAITQLFGFAIFFDVNWKRIKIEQWKDIIESSNYIDITDLFIEQSENIKLETKSYALKQKWDNDEYTKEPFAKVQNDANIRYWFSTDLPEVTKTNEVLFIVPLNHYMISINGAAGVFWSDFTDNFEDITPNADNEEIEIKISTLTAYVKPSEFAYPIFIPRIAQIGSNIENGNNNPGFKLLNFHGFTDANGLPYASSTNYDFNGNETSGINLQLQGEKGIYEQFLKSYYDYLSECDLIEMDFRMNAISFQQLIKIYKAECDYRKVRVGSKNYIPIETDITITKHGFGNCKLKLR